MELNVICYMLYIAPGCLIKSTLRWHCKLTWCWLIWGAAYVLFITILPCTSGIKEQCVIQFAGISPSHRNSCLMFVLHAHIIHYIGVYFKSTYLLHTRIYTCTYAHTYTCTHTYTRTHIHTHTHKRWASHDQTTWAACVLKREGKAPRPRRLCTMIKPFLRLSSHSI